MPDQSLNILEILFTGHIEPWEVPALRGAIGRKVGAEGVLFHHHEGDGLRYRYPLIQYGQLRGRPQLICLGEGVDAIHQYFGQPDWSVTLGERQLDMQVDSLNLYPFTLGMSEELRPYRVQRWIGLNQRNYPQYRQLSSLAERIHFLERKLIGNLLSLAKGVGWHVPAQIELHIEDLTELTPIKLKGMSFHNFDVKMACNLVLPPGLGIGGKVSLGMGRLRPGGQ